METVKKVEKVEKVEKVVLPRRRIQQRVAPLGAIPFALLLDASLVLGCPGGRRAAARLDPLRIGPSIRLWFAGAEPPTRFCVRIQQQVEARPAVGYDLLLDSTHSSRRPPVMPMARCSPPVPTHRPAAPRCNLLALRIQQQVEAWLAAFLLDASFPVCSAQMVMWRPSVRRSDRFSSPVLQPRSAARRLSRPLGAHGSSAIRGHGALWRSVSFFFLEQMSPHLSSCGT